jgi:hypothetical protein
MPDLRRGFDLHSIKFVPLPIGGKNKKWMNDGNEGNEGNIAEGKKVHPKNMQFALGLYRLCRTLHIVVLFPRLLFAICLCRDDRSHKFNSTKNGCTKEQYGMVKVELGRDNG